MAKTTKSQWDFGELFPTAAIRQVVTVSELTTRIRRLLEGQIGGVWVSGEVTNLRAQASGHCYFTLKDAAAQLSCVLFRGEAKASRALLQDGQRLLLQGDLTVYEPRGQYQLRVVSIEPLGVGALQAAFERLKQKLSAEGLFAPERKRPIPRYSKRIGVVSSPTGAALRDVLHVVERRNPALELVLAPCRVQGQGAAEEIAAAIDLLNLWSARATRPATGADAVCGAGGLDLILVTRGGGSLEDLWAFNEEVVARAIHRSALPVVSAVGHEIDFTIADFTADMRAATPSAAAEILTEGVVSSRQFLDRAGERLRTLLRQRWARESDYAAALARRLARAHPKRRLYEQWQRLDDLRGSLTRGAGLRLREMAGRWATLQRRWSRLRPGQTLAARRQSLARARDRLGEQAWLRYQAWQSRHATLTARLQALSPEAVLGRGYSISRDRVSGRVIRAADEVRAGQSITTRVRTGEFGSVVE